MKTHVMAVALGLLLATGSAAAGTPINQTHPLEAKGRIEVSNVQGRLEVRGWDRPQVQISGELGDGAHPLQVTGDARQLQVHVRHPRMGRRPQPTVLILRVPFQADLEVETVSADIDIDGIAPRELRAESVSGAIRAVGAPRKAELESVSGRIDATLNSADVQAESVSGGVRLSGRLSDSVEVDSVSGDVVVDTLGERLRRLSVETVSGGAQVVAGLQPRGEAQLESLSGNVLLRLQADLSARLEGESFSGRITAPGASAGSQRPGPGSSVRHDYGRGDGRIRLETFSGNATLRLDAPAAPDR